MSPSLHRTIMEHGMLSGLSSAAEDGDSLGGIELQGAENIIDKTDCHLVRIISGFPASMYT